MNGDFFVIRHGSYTRQHGYTSYQPIAEIDCKPVRDFVAKANPATVLELLDELEAKDKRIADMEAREVVLPRAHDVHPLGPQSAKIFCEFHRSIVNRCADEIRKVGVKVSIKGN
ncbi:ead/Ea22-like family protein [Escherichia coli]|nr:ead/Ea22-like family protein [Escherichia coli]MCC0756613.1 ead/Ea22-like family protein [Escherichia coli]